MNKIIFIIIIFSIGSCTHSDKEYYVLKKRIDSLEYELAETYKPGFGEIMSSVQAHHAKLWFAGKNRNWRLADFEIHEINEL
ncbi:MAG TPA: hypothetical protein ENK91_09555, partial [Bacteroidetes bacterium]|nr:hypothetical protein [Bacteroidota bacterium]